MTLYLSVMSALKNKTKKDLKFLVNYYPHNLTLHSKPVSDSQTGAPAPF